MPRKKRVEIKRGERRYDTVGEIRYMTRVESYVVVRRPHCAPYVMRESAWLALPTDPHLHPDVE